MKVIYSLTLLFLFLFSQESASQNKIIKFETSSLKDILALAKKENKMVYIDCYTTWCGPCKWMDKNIFTNDAVADFYNKVFINAKFDMEKGEGIEIAKKYSIKNYPSMLYLNAEGIQMHRTCGSAPAEEFISNGEIAVSENNMAALNTKFNSGKVNHEIASSYLASLDNACLSYTDEANKYFESIPAEEYKSHENWLIIYDFVEDYYSKAFQYLENNKTYFSEMSSVDSVESKIVQVYESGLTTSLEKNDMAVYESLKTKLRNSNVKDAEKIILQADIKTARKEQNWTEFASLSSTYVNQYAMEDARELNSYAWTFYQKVDDKKMLSNAENWAKKATELEDNYANNDTYAAVLYKSGKKAEAKVAAKKAISVAQQNGEDFSETQALLEKINALK
ncbi:MAG: DUF255 domain-containing protein [Bacteroidia bacterium]|nr:DUF255 domain-containing protein [Bacteroidia bacterium]